MNITINESTLEELVDSISSPNSSVFEIDELTRAFGHMANALEEVGLTPTDYL